MKRALLGALLLSAAACGRAAPNDAGAAVETVKRYRFDRDEIIFSDEATDEDMAVLDAHPELKGLAFSRGPNTRPPIRVTAKGLAHLASVKHLERLRLNDVFVP